ncbi:MAG: DUF2284 domain-containing protein [Phycisphaerales bacterium]|nr:MAG: DUF2284 domain-containing protein [Phycisphaerales bacterium]
MSKREELEALFAEHGFDDFRWFEPRHVVIAEWVRMKCRFGCRDYGESATCPPNIPSLQECERFFLEYEEAVLFHFSKAVPKPEDRHAWTRSINKRLVKLERAVFIAGHQKAFVLFIDPCNLCEECAGTPADCRIPHNARPAPEAMGVDLFSTVRKCGYEIEVLSDYSQEMNRFGMLLVR